MTNGEAPIGWQAIRHSNLVIPSSFVIRNLSLCGGLNSRPSPMVDDLKFAFRQLLKHPGFTTIAVLTLALGIMAATAMYSVIHAVLLDPFPYKDVDHLMSVK